MPSWRVSAWTHPAAVPFEVIEHSIPIIRGSFHDPVEPRGRCQFDVDATWAWEDLIAADPVTPANNRNALIRVFADGIDNTGDPDQEFYLERFERKIDEDGVEVVRFYGRAWKLAGLDAARLRWWDWEAGATKTTQPDWEYGGPNIAPDFDDPSSTPQIFHVWHEGTAGTLDLGDGVDDTTLAWNAAAGAVENGLENDIASITDVKVIGPDSGPPTEDDPWVIEYGVPAFGNTLVGDDTLLTGDGLVIEEQSAGGLALNSWTKSQTVSRGVPIIFGEYGEFYVTDAQAPPGHTHSLRINPAPIGRRYAGAQVVLNVTPGALHQSAISIRPVNATNKYRFVIRSIWGEFIASDTGGLSGTSYTANVWTVIEIPDFYTTTESGIDVDQVIMRIANVDATGNPDVFHIGAPEFRRGQGAQTIGIISNELLDDAQVDHSPIVVIPWIQAGGYTATDDSSAATWTQEESMILRRGMFYGTHIFGGKIAELGYEYDVVPNQDTAIWDLEIWNEGNRGTTHTGTFAFVVGMGVEGGLVAGRVPKANRVLAEGADGIIAEVSDSTQEGIFGTWMDWLGDPDLTDLTTLTAAANERLADHLENALALSVELDASAPTPYTDFDVGDTAPFQAAGYMTAHSRRISEIKLIARTEEGETIWTPSVTASRLFQGEEAKGEALYDLLNEFDRMPEERAGLGPADLLTGGGGGMATVLIAGIDASANTIALSHVQAQGSDDQEAFDRAVDLLPAEGGEIVFEGTLYMTGTHSVPTKDIIYRGLGGAIIDHSGFAGAAFEGSGTSTWLSQTFQNFSFTGGASSAVGIRRIAGAGAYTITTYQQLHFHDWIGSACIGAGATATSQGGEGIIRVIDCSFTEVEVLGGGSLNAGVIHDDSGGPHHIITGCHFQDITHTQGGSACVRLESDTEALVINNSFVNAGTLDSSSGAVYWRHNLVDGVMQDGIPTATISNAVRQITPFSYSGELPVKNGTFFLVWPFDVTIYSVRGTVGVPATGSAIILDAVDNGATSLFVTASNPTIAAAANVGAAAPVDNGSYDIAAGNYLRVDITQIGATTPGEDLTVIVEWSTDL